MVDLTEVLKRFDKRIQQHHLAGDRLVAVVLDDLTKVELEKAATDQKIEAFVTVAPKVIIQEEIPVSTDDSIGIFYFGTMAVANMKVTGFGKKENHQFAPRFIEILKAKPFFEPIILSADLTVIDGEQRILAAKTIGIHRLPAIVLNTNTLQAKFFRLVLNKSNEFQRWHWDAVDTFLEEHPELLPQLEPLGIFGERVLPESYFGNTVIGYEIHAEEGVKSQQSFYKQEHGLARWAKLRREADALEAENSKSAKKAASFDNTTPLF